MPGPNPLPAGPVAAVKGLVLPFQLPLQPPWRWPKRSLMGAMRSGPPQAQYWDREGLFSHVIWKIVIYLESEEKPPVLTGDRGGNPSPRYAPPVGCPATTTANKDRR